MFSQANRRVAERNAIRPRETELFRRPQKIAAFTLEFTIIYLEAALIYWLGCRVRRDT